MHTLTETAMAPLGQAVLDYMNDRSFEYLVTERDDGYRTETAVSQFFRTALDMAPHEQLALERCHGRILDVGAGAGSHALLLQQHGRQVWAIDISPQHVEVMHQRGIKRADCRDVWELEGQRYDTLLLMGHGIGLVDDLKELDLFLLHCRDLVSGNGQMLINGFNYYMTDRIEHIRYHEQNAQQGLFPGSARLRLIYDGNTGPWFNWLLIDMKTLRQAALATGWNYELLMEEEDGNYLARLY